jgi:hypothetical protein
VPHSLSRISCGAQRAQAGAAGAPTEGRRLGQASMAPALAQQSTLTASSARAARANVRTIARPHSGWRPAERRAGDPGPLPPPTPLPPRGCTGSYLEPPSQAFRHCFPRQSRHKTPRVRPRSPVAVSIAAVKHMMYDFLLHRLNHCTIDGISNILSRATGLTCSPFAQNIFGL